MNIEYLKWDSDFFEMKIGKVIANKHIKEIYLKQLLNIAKTENYSLLYVFTPEKEIFSEKILSETNGNLVDRKTIYSLNIEKKTTKNHPEISDYSTGKLNDDLLELSYLSGHYSRFKLDKKLPNSSFKRLYKEWIEKSLNDNLADKVFVALDNEEIIGFVTLRIKESGGEIGLIAVSEKVQGKKYGTKLMDQCIQYLKEKSINTLLVPTQLENKQACKFYENYGFTIYSITNIYHFWI